MVFITSEEHLVAGEKTEGVRGHLRYQLRKAAVLAVHSGRSVAQVAADYNVAVRSVYDWLRCQRLGGWEALEEGKRDGRPRKAGSVAEQWMAREILEGKADGLWSLDRMVESLQRDCGVRVSKNTAHRLLRRAGVSFGDTNDWKVLRVLGGRFPGAPRRGVQDGFQRYLLESRMVWLGKDEVGRWLTSARSQRGDILFRVDSGGGAGDHFLAFVTGLQSLSKRPLMLVIRGDVGAARSQLEEMSREGESRLVVVPWDRDLDRCCLPSLAADKGHRPGWHAA
jgi:transposase